MKLITVDTLNFAVCGSDPFQLLGLDQDIFEQGSRPEMNYTGCVYYQGIKISLGGTAGYDSYVNLSGKGCRTLEDLHGKDFSWYDLLCLLRIYKVSFRRIDIAVDDDSGAFDVRKCVRYYEQGMIAGSCRTFKYTLGAEEIFYAGSPQSNVLLRIYNKALERGYDDGLKDGKPWLRSELQLRNEAAEQIIMEWCGNPISTKTFSDLQTIYSGHLLNHCRFLTKQNPGPHSDRIPTAKWWSDFLGDVQKIKFVSAPGSDYNLQRCHRYLREQAASSIKAYIMACGITPDQLYKEFTSEGIKLNPDQEYMIKMMRGNIHEEKS